MIIIWKLLNVTSRIAKVRILYINIYIYNITFILCVFRRNPLNVFIKQRDECVKKITKGSSIGIITSTSIKRRYGYYRRRVNWE